MKLLIDAGNTRLKLGWLSDDGDRETVPFSCLPTELVTCLTDWLATVPQPPVSATAASVLRDEANAALEHTLSALTGCPVHWQRPQSECLGMRTHYHEPERLGVDRWLAMLGLWRHPQHAQARAQGSIDVLATFGTATTIDTLNPNGDFVGGLILPGFTLMRRSLHQGTARLPDHPGELQEFPITTESAIHSGVLAAQVGAVWRQVKLARRAWPDAPCRLLVSGGAWPEVAPALQHTEGLLPADVTVQWLDRPVLDGLAVLAANSAPHPHPTV